MTTETKTTALEFLNQHVDDGPIVFYTSAGAPSGSSVAYHPQYWDVPISDLNDLSGSVADGEWRWDGNGHPTDCNQNSVTQLLIYPDQAEWDRQCADYLEDEG